jgi:predicted dehydrogenase
MSTPYNIGLIGCRFGAYVARDMAKLDNPPVKLAVVCDLNPDLAVPLAKELGVRAESDYKKLLNDPEIKAIGLYTGPVGRAKFIHEILQAGKDVMTTKPFEADPAQAQWILDEARKMGRVIHLNSPGPKVPDSIVTTQKWQREFDLGRPAYFIMSVHASYNEKPDGSWYDDPERCPAAPLFRLGIYLVNDIQALIGKVDSVELVQTRLRTGRPTADNAVLALRMKNGAVGTMVASFCVQDGDHYRNSLQLSFERGTVYRDFGPQRTGPGRDEMTLIQEKEGKREITATHRAEAGSNGYDWDAFAEAVKNRIPADEVYADRIVSGVEVMKLIADAQRAQPL